MIHVTFDIEAAAADTPSRTISGVAVPWNETGRVADGRRVRFLPGSLPADARPVTLRDHDQTRPIGRVLNASDTGSAMRAAVRVSQTRDGDEALILAADEVLGAFSVGADPVRWRTADDGVLEVIEATWNELSLLTRGAFASARVDTVAASSSDPDPPEPDDEPEPDPDEDNPDEDNQEEDDVEPITATAPAVVPITAAPSRRAEPPLTLQRIASIVAGAPNGQVNQMLTSIIEAATSTTGALENVLTTDVAGFLRPAYLNEITGLITRGRPTIENISRRTLPDGAMTVSWANWTNLAAPGKQSAQKAAIPTGPVSVAAVTKDLDTWAWGNDIALQAVQRTNPSFMEEYFRMVAEMMARKQNDAVVTALLADAAAATPGADFTENLQALMAALDFDFVPDGPLLLGVATDVWIEMIGLKDADKPAFWTGSVSFGGSNSGEVSASGLRVFVDHSYPAGTYLLGAVNAAQWIENPLVELRVIDVSLLGVDAGVYQYALLREVYDFSKSFAKITGGALAAKSAAKKS